MNNNEIHIMNYIKKKKIFNNQKTNLVLFKTGNEFIFNDKKLNN